MRTFKSEHSAFKAPATGIYELQKEDKAEAEAESLKQHSIRKNGTRKIHCWAATEIPLPAQTVEAQETPTYFA